MTKTVTKSRLPRTGTLVVIAIVLLVGCGMMMVWGPYHRNQTAIAEIARLGGRTESEFAPPLWIPDVLASEIMPLFERVYHIDLTETHITDEDLGNFQGLTNLKILWLDNTQVGDVGLQHVGGLTDCSQLSLHNTPVGDDGMEHLRGLKNLHVLWLHHTHVTETGFKRLQAALPECQIHWRPSTP